MSEKMGFQVHGNYFEGNFRSVRKLFKKKKKKNHAFLLRLSFSVDGILSVDPL